MVRNYMIDKELVRERFRKNLKTYNANSFVQAKMADRLVSMAEGTYSDVLELGCGSGGLTEKLIKKISFKTYNAVDIVPECEEYIRNISSEISFYHSDIETYNFKQKYDLIISNATFQWVEDLDGFIRRLKQSLNPDGVLIFSTFGEENFKEITSLTGVGLKYYSVSELQAMISPDMIEGEIIPLKFNSPKEVLKHLKLTGVNSLASKRWTKTDLNNFGHNYEKLCPDGISLTYNPVYVLLKCV